MGYIRHHAIVVTGMDFGSKDMKQAHKKAKKIFTPYEHSSSKGTGNSLVSEIIKSNVNGYVSFFIAPDGSKEGWEESDDGNAKRKKFIKWIDKQAYSDGSNSIQYAELYYADDGGESKIVKHN